MAIRSLVESFWFVWRVVFSGTFVSESGHDEGSLQSRAVK